MSEHSAAWHEGWQAFVVGSPHGANPYLGRHDACAKEWQSGYTAAGNVKAATPRQYLPTNP